MRPPSNLRRSLTRDPRPPRPLMGWGTRSCLLLIAACLLPGTARGAGGELNYNRDIRPILSAHCFSCHGPDSNSREADLRLDQREAAVEHAIVPGDASASEVVKRINASDEYELMPPPDAKKPLSQKQRDLLVRWINEGADYAQHWSFIAPTRPALPKVQQSEWPRNAIDHFVLSKIEEQGLRPSPAADPATLIRRVSYDLTGLPPTLPDLDRFLALADRDDHWYEQVVDYYLSLPAFGERMALAWLDASRYGDTSVFHADGPRDMWPWRDWVINAYNTNKPFDEFTIEQLAGDLLPNATPLQKVASGFNRNHATTDEGGAIAEEWRVDYVVDRVKTTSNVWLGISMECGQCHRHKFDPISQKEYYQFFAFFNQTTDPGMQTRKGNQAPVVNVPDPLRDKEIAALEQTREALDAKIASRGDEIDEPFSAWLVEAEQSAQSSEGASLPGDLQAYFPLDEGKGSSAIDSVKPERKATVKGKSQWESGKFGSAFKVDGSNWIEFQGDGVGDFEHNQGFSYGCWVKPQGAPMGSPLAKMNEGNSHRGWDLMFSNGQLSVHIINTWPSNAIKVTTKGKVAPNKWTHIFATYDGSGKAAGVTIYFDGKPQPWDVNEDRLSATTISKVPVKIGRRHSSLGYKGLIDDVRLYARTLAETEVAALAGNDPLGPLLAIPAAERTPEQQQQLKTHYLTTVDSQYKRLQKEKSQLSSKIAALKKQSVTSMIMGEQQKPRETYVLMRGHYASPDKSEVIKPGVPSVLPPLPADAPANRLGLARWLVSPEHPLTSRVTVNRYWSMIFGRGIVATPMDLGSQGAWPTHPALLDYLAIDFRESGWDIKRMWKQILMSQTYRQSSATRPDLRAADPQNLLLARSPRYRLQGEMIRDTALQTSGLLVDVVGGPGVKPYQPPGLWNEVSLSGNVRFVQDKGEKLYRKSMYIYWKRSAPHPGMRILDAPTREKCVVQRPRTNTPLQALYTMNGVQFVEASRALAARMVGQSEQPEERLAFGYRLLTSHEPSPRAITALRELLEESLQKYQQDEEAAKKLLGIGDSLREESIPPVEHAAYTVVANVLLNMDLSLTRF